MTQVASAMFFVFGLIFGLTSFLGAAEISADGRILTGAGDGGGRSAAAATNPGGYGGKGGLGGGGGGGGRFNGSGNDANGGDGGIGGGGGGGASCDGGSGGGIDSEGTTETELSGAGGGFGSGGGGGCIGPWAGGGYGGTGDGDGGIGADGLSGGGGGYGSDDGGDGGNSVGSIFGNIGGGGGGGAGKALTGVASFSVSSDITAGHGGSAPLTGGGGGGGVGLVIYDASTVTSTSAILGGNGGETAEGNAGQGGAGVFLVGASTSHTEVGQHAGGVFNNYGTVRGGTGGLSSDGLSGSGGHGILANNAAINNYGTGSIHGGNAGTDGATGNDGGHGIYAHSHSSFATEITNYGAISGGNGTGTGGIGGYGVQLTGDNGKIYNNASVTGGTNGDGSRRAAIKIGTDGIASTDNEVHMTSAASFIGDVDASDAINTKLVLTGDDDGSFDMSRLVSADGAAADEFINFARLGKEGASTWTLTGTASGNQDWEITAGTLIGSADTIKGNADIAAAASLEFKQTSDGAYDGLLSGGGTMVKSGSGTLTITSIGSTFTGTNAVKAGKLKGDANTIKGNAAVSAGASLEFNQTSDGTYAGVLSGGGTVIKSGSGTLALTNTGNSFTGTNAIMEGTLQGTTDTIKGDAVIASGATLEFNQAVDGVYAGNLSGSGELVNSGGGVLTFTGSNAGFAGKAAVDTGIMRLDHPLALGSGPITNNAELELSFSGPFPNALSGSGDVTVDAADKTVEFSTAKTYTGATTVAAGTLKASTQNAFAGSILLDIKSDAAFAATAAQNIKDFRLAENASADFNHNNLTLEKGDIRGDLADVADLIKTTSGELKQQADVAIGGNLSHQQGGITIAKGKTLTVAGNANFAADTDFRVHPGEVAALRAGTISFADAGPVIDLIGYSGTDSYVVAEAESGAIGSNYRVRIGGNPVGTGIGLQTFALPNLVRQDGNRQLVATTALVWNNTDSASAHGVFDIPGSYTIDSALTDNDNPTAMYTEGSYAWDGKSLDKRGSGRLILARRNAYTGPTTVEAGTLQLGLSPQREGGIASGGVAVKAGGSLEGFGRVDGDVSIESGGTLMAGDGVTAGIISVKNLGMASGARFIIPAAGSIHVDEHAHIDGAVEFSLQSADIASDTPRTFINAGSLSGLTPDKEVELAFVTYILKQVESGGRVDLNLDVQEVRDLVSAAITPNQSGVATALDAWNGGDNRLREKILLLAGQAEATQAFDLLASELSASSRSHLLAINQQFWSYLSGSARTVRTSYLPDISVSSGDAYAALSPDFRFSRGFFAWGQAGGTVMRTSPDANSAKGKTTSYDFALGLEGGSDNFRLGLVFRRADSRLEIDDRLSRSDTDSHNLGIYALTSFAKGPGRLLFSLGLAGGLHDNDTRRDVSFSDFSERLAAHYQAKSMQSFLEAGYSLAPSTDSSVEPYANLTLNTLWNPAVTENGGLASTHAEADRQSTLATTVGGRYSYNISNWSSLDLDLAFRHTFGAVSPSSRLYFANDPGRNSFTTVGSGLTRDEAVLGVQYRLMPREYLELSFGYQAAFGKRSAYQRGTFTAGLIF